MYSLEVRFPTPSRRVGARAGLAIAGRGNRMRCLVICEGESFTADAICGGRSSFRVDWMSPKGGLSVRGKSTVNLVSVWFSIGSNRYNKSTVTPNST